MQLLLLLMSLLFLQVRGEVVLLPSLFAHESFELASLFVEQLCALPLELGRLHLQQHGTSQNRTIQRRHTINRTLT